MKVKVLIVAILSVVTAVATAQNFGTVSAEQTAIQSQQIMNGGAYDGTVYEPFGSTTPSDQNFTPAQAPGGPRRNPIATDDDEEGWTDKPDVGGTDLSPIGDAVLPMLLCAVAFCGVIALRRKRSADQAAR